MDAFKNDKINYIIFDYVFVWSNPKQYEIVSYLDQKESDKYGVLFPIESKYFAKFNDAFNYFLSSVKFLKLLRKYFGQEAVLFYNKSLAAHKLYFLLRIWKINRELLTI
jgi:ABC-type amino acid transport substrate-binding protein